MITFKEEQYLTASEVSRRLNISHVTCRANVVPLLTECYLPGRKRPVYKQTEVEELSQVRTVEKQVKSLTLVQEVAS